MWVASTSERSVAVFFKDPTQITRISIKQVKNPGIILVRMSLRKMVTSAAAGHYPQVPSPPGIFGAGQNLVIANPLS